MRRIIGVLLSVLAAVLFFGGCGTNTPPEESEIRSQLVGEWVNWLGGEDGESLVYIFTETDITEQRLINGVLTEQREGTYSISGAEYVRGSWQGTVTAELGDDILHIPFRTDRERKNLALGVSGDKNSPGYAKRRKP